ncbi:hypothetical protein [Spirosoma montaniterrae]|uniref:Glycosyl transferase n=1 Tax=Spirosoma montaniterrae TaxID=1178516 RepID=A0A1P9WW97_9BACT|nr:hypothetical protein [Spirosoma montaniterrae]AQG79665.1 hypothetical protein AWR27_10195 [Spirosoma montaniterrae]
MLVTICNIRQLPQAFALGDSFIRQTPLQTGSSPAVLIGLADDPARLPANFESPFPLVPVSNFLSDSQLADLSAAYTPTEFAAACKPAFIADVFQRYADVDDVIYADPNIFFVSSTILITDRLRQSTLLLTPYVTRSPGDGLWPDEKFFQNVGLYNADFLAFRRSDETARMLTWWQDRTTGRARIDFCEGLCTDQIWLMHVPVFFRDVQIIKNPGWHTGIWNLPERRLDKTPEGWVVSVPAEQNQPLLFANFKGLYNRNEGFFPHQTRLSLASRPDVRTLLTVYQQALSVHLHPALAQVSPALGQRSEPVILRGWRHTLVRSLRNMVKYVNQVPLPAVR